ncbi:MAG: hypothetical protein ACHRHE_18515 [Tepidisphaerales bacterium]
MFPNHCRLVPFVSVLILTFAASRASSQGAAGVPDPSTMLPLVPDAAKAGPPAWIKPGTRLTYFGASATVRGERSQLVLDPNGKWVNKATGDKWGEQEVPTGSGAGYSTFQVGYVDRDVAALTCRLYLLDTTTRKTSLVGDSGTVTNSGCGLDLWVHPEVLKKVQEVNANGVRIMRMPYAINNHRYNAIRFQTESDQGYSAYVYDLDTGVMVFHGSSAQGAGVLTAPPAGGGLAGMGRGSTQLVTSWLMEVKDVPMPWANAPAPAWLGKVQEMEFRGAQSTMMAGVPPLSLPLTAQVKVKARGPGWLRGERTTVIQSIAGMPPQQDTQGVASGIATFGGLWIGPEGLNKLQRGQVLDRNEITQTVQSVADVGPRQVTISEVGPLHRSDLTYDTTSGMLIGVNLTQQVGLATMGVRATLAGWR